MVLFLIFFLFFLIIFFTCFNKTMEGFSWSQNTEDLFNQYIKNSFPFLKFDISKVKEQATEADVLYLLKHNHWFWNPKTIKEYKNQISKSSILSVDLDSAVDRSRKIYNNTVMKELLFWNTPEGKFLIYGSDNGNIKCSDNGIIKNGKLIDNNDIPNEISGFTFLSNPCNPCIRINNPLNETCQFKKN
uniref:Uncharacterized protein n=1 Tax=viral metagenome TaxID=1070528 RepID=A0A6C0H6A2_9ZZZZ